MTSTTPIYLGCRNIDEYFPNSVIHLSGNVNKDMELIKNIVENPDKYKKYISNTYSIKSNNNKSFKITDFRFSKNKS